MLRYLCLLLLVVSFAPLFAQGGWSPTMTIPLFQGDDDDEEVDDERRGFGLAVNIGVYFANKRSANLYNGSCLLEIEDDPQGVRCYTIQERLNLVPQDIQSIQNFYGASGVSYPSDMHPYSMRYNPTVVYGLNVAYYFNDYSQLIFNLNNLRLKAEDQFTLILQGTGQQQNGQTDTRLFPIWGEEARLNITGGYRQGWEINPEMLWFFEGGGSMVSSKVLSNTIRVADRNYDLLLGAQNPNQIVNFTPRARTGFGWYLETGVSLIQNETYRIDAGLSFFRDRIRLENYDSLLSSEKRYQRLTSWSIQIRFGI